MHWRNHPLNRSNQTRQCLPLRESWIQTVCLTLAPRRHVVWNKQPCNRLFIFTFLLNREQCCIPRTVLTFWDPRRKAKRTRHMGSRTRQQLRLRTDAEALLTHNPSWTNIARVRLREERNGTCVSIVSLFSVKPNGSHALSAHQNSGVSWCFIVLQKHTACYPVLTGKEKALILASRSY